MLFSMFNLHEKFMLFAGFLTWVLGDIITTYYGLSIGLTEANPAFPWLSIETFGAVIIIKLIAFAIAFYLIRMEKISKPDKINAFAMAFLCYSLGLAITVSNFIGILRVMYA